MFGREKAGSEIFKIDAPRRSWGSRFWGAVEKLGDFFEGTPSGGEEWAINATYDLSKLNANLPELSGSHRVFKPKEVVAANAIQPEPIVEEPMTTEEISTNSAVLEEEIVVTGQTTENVGEEVFIETPIGSVVEKAESNVDPLFERINFTEIPFKERWVGEKPNNRISLLAESASAVVISSSAGQFVGKAIEQVRQNSHGVTAKKALVSSIILTAPLAFKGFKRFTLR